MTAFSKVCNENISQAQKHSLNAIFELLKQLQTVFRREPPSSLHPANCHNRTLMYTVHSTITTSSSLLICLRSWDSNVFFISFQNVRLLECRSRSSPTLTFGNDVAETATRVARLPGTLEHLYLEENYQQNSKNGEKHEKVERQKRLIFVLARCQISQTTVLS